MKKSLFILLAIVVGVLLTLYVIRWIVAFYLIFSVL